MLKSGLHSLTPRVQLLALVGATIAIALAVGLSSVIARRTENPAGSAHSQPASAAGTLRLPPEQLGSLKIEPVRLAVFFDNEITEGKIAINADRATPVFSPYSGRVTRVLAKPGDVVDKGTRLLELEATEFVQGQNDLTAASAALATAQSQLALAQSSERRKHALYDAKAGSLQDWQQSQADLATAQNNLHAAETAVALVRNKLRILGMSDAQIETLPNDRKMRAGAAVTAPIHGTVTDRQVGPGQYLQSGASNPVFVISDLSTVWLVANVREADAPAMRRGARVSVRVLALPGRVFDARLTYVAPSIDSATRRLQVRAEVPNPDGVLKPEMFATFSIDAGGEKRAPSVPESAIVYEGNAARVWVAQSGGVVASREVRTGRTGNGLVEIVEGLQPDEQVVTAGTLFIDRAASGG